jgi:hypothetical protein
MALLRCPLGVHLILGPLFFGECPNPRVLPYKEFLRLSKFTQMKS